MQFEGFHVVSDDEIVEVQCYAEALLPRYVPDGCYTVVAAACEPVSQAGGQPATYVAPEETVPDTSKKLYITMYCKFPLAFFTFICQSFLENSSDTLRIF